MIITDVIDFQYNPQKGHPMNESVTVTKETAKLINHLLHHYSIANPERPSDEPMYKVTIEDDDEFATWSYSLQAQVWSRALTGEGVGPVSQGPYGNGKVTAIRVRCKKSQRYASMSKLRNALIDAGWELI